VLLLVLISNGRVLDLRIGAEAGSPLVPVITSLFCWVILLILPVQVTVGRWKNRRHLKHYSLLGLLTLIFALAALSALPSSASEVAGAVVCGLCGLAAALIAHRLTPLR
jgi:uncharacterized membrane protein YhaH (DUF805 family)